MRCRRSAPAAFDKLKTALTALKATTAFDTRTVTATGRSEQCR